MNKVKEKFDKIAGEYASFAYLAQHAGDQLLRRLSIMNIKPTRILELGCAGGRQSIQLKNLFPDSQLLVADLSLVMLEKISIEKLQLDAQQLPFISHSVDVVFVNLTFNFCDLVESLKEVQRVLKPQGLLLFSMLGPDTAKELGKQRFSDMHDVGDALVRSGLIDPVMEVEQLELQYDTAEKCQRELEGCGLSLLIENEKQAKQYSVELIYGHAWVPKERDTFSAGDDGVVRVPLGRVRRQNK